MSGFNFGSTAPTGGFSFGTPKTVAPTQSSGFSFGATAGAAPAGGFSFGGTPQNQVSSSAQPTGPFSFSTPVAASAATPSGFSFGAQAVSTPAPAAGGLTFGTNTPKLNLGSGLPSAAVAANVSSAPQPAQPSGGFSFGSNAAPAPAATGGFSFGGAAPANVPSNAFGQTAAPTGLSFGTPVSTPVVPVATSTQVATTFSLGVPAAANSLGFGLPSVVATSIPSAPTAAAPLTAIGSTAGTGLSFGVKPLDAATAAVSNVTATSTAQSISSLLGSSGTSLFSPVVSSAAPAPTTTPSTAATGLTLGSAGTGFSFGLKTPASSAAQAGTLTTSSSLAVKPLVGVSGVAVQASAATTAVNTGVSTTPVMTYVQLENLINKWSLELEDQEKHFLQQATQVNAWDRTLIHNGERITTLHREMEKVKLDQRRLDQELDFILSQQKELEDLLNPLEESVKEQSGTIYLQHADEEREKTYKLAENIDAQLKRMAQDLKDVIEHLNTSAGPGDTSNPLQQICKILNAHMDSLQWIDQNSALLQRKVEQVTKECESRRKEQDRGFPITFD
ncbi:nuclear pore glycoprotein p62-like [Pelodytes ibericus]